MPKTVEEYLSLPYTTILRKDSDENIFVARVEELPGCSAHGDTEQDALFNLRENMEVWIQDCLESGDPVPEPIKEIELPSGKWLQRVPRSLHLKLIQLAKNESVSLNQLVSSTLAEAVGNRSAGAAPQSCLDSRNRDWLYINHVWNQSMFVAKECEFEIDKQSTAQASPAAEIFVQHLAENIVGVFANNAIRKERVSYGQRPKPLFSVRS